MTSEILHFIRCQAQELIDSGLRSCSKAGSSLQMCATTIDQLQADLTTAKTALDEADKRNLSLSEQIDAMIIRSNAVARYAMHSSTCRMPMAPCTCGLDDLLKGQS